MAISWVSADGEFIGSAKISLSETYFAKLLPFM